MTFIMFLTSFLYLTLHHLLKGNELRRGATQSDRQAMEQSEFSRVLILWSRPVFLLHYINSAL